MTGGILDQGAGRYVTYGELVGRGLRGGYRARVTQTGDTFTGRFTYSDARGSFSGTNAGTTSAGADGAIALPTA